jgi:hypothetical protein
MWYISDTQPTNAHVNPTGYSTSRRYFRPPPAGRCIYCANRQPDWCDGIWVDVICKHCVPIVLDIFRAPKYRPNIRAMEELRPFLHSNHRPEMLQAQKRFIEHLREPLHDLLQWRYSWTDRTDLTAGRIIKEDIPVLSGIKEYDRRRLMLYMLVSTTDFSSILRMDFHNPPRFGENMYFWATQRRMVDTFALSDIMRGRSFGGDMDTLLKRHFLGQWCFMCGNWCPIIRCKNACGNIFCSNMCAEEHISRDTCTHTTTSEEHKASGSAGATSHAAASSSASRELRDDRKDDNADLLRTRERSPVIPSAAHSSEARPQRDASYDSPTSFLRPDAAELLRTKPREERDRNH